MSSTIDAPVTLNNFSVSIRADTAQDGQAAVAAQHVKENGNHYVKLVDHTEYSLALHNNRDTRARAEVTIDNEHMGNWILHPHQRVHLERPIKAQRKFTFVADTSKAAASAGVVAGKKENGLVSIKFVPEKPRETQALWDSLCLNKSSGMRVGLFGGRAGTSRGSFGAFGSSRDAGNFESSNAGASRSVMQDNNIEDECVQDDCAPERENCSRVSFGAFGSAAPGAAAGFLFSKPAAASRGISTKESLSNARSGATILGAQSNQTYGTAPDVTDIDEPNVTTITLRLIAVDPPAPEPKYMHLSSLRGPVATQVPPPLPSSSSSSQRFETQPAYL
jgi:hypothetical protein